MVRWLVCLLGLTLSFSAYSASPFKGMDKQGRVEVARADLFPLFDGVESSHILATEISYKTNLFSGLLVVAPIDSTQTYRMAFTSYFGLTVFDFEVGVNTFIVHRCLEQLERKAVLSILEQDFRALLMLNIPSQTTAVKYVMGDVVGYKIKTLDGKCYYQVNPQHSQWLAMDRKGLITALQIRLSDYEATGFPQIEMAHPKIGLKMVMQKMQED